MHKDQYIPMFFFAENMLERWHGRSLGAKGFYRTTFTHAPEQVGVSIARLFMKMIGQISRLVSQPFAYRS